jgi:YesN/AraC family two-component response regulator
VTQSHVFMELWQARCVQGYVAVHLHSKIDLGDLAKVTQFAQNLMTVSGEPLCQIATESGFADQSHFNRCFREVVGESPSVWRARRSQSFIAPGPRG